MRKPRPYQVVAIKRLRSLDSALLFVPLRGRKTAIIIDALRRGNRLPRMLVVSPLTVISVWQNELHAEGISTHVVVIRGTRKQKRNLMKTSGNVVFLTNYETISAMRTDAALYLSDCEAVVLDESTKIKHSYTNTAKAVCGSLRRIRRRFVLTGTPVTESLLDLWQQVDFVSPDLFHSSFFVWRETYFTPNYWGTKWAPNSDTKEELFSKIAFITVSVDEKAVGLGPEKDIPVSLELTPEMRSAYDQLQKSFTSTLARHGWESNYIVAVMEKLSQICSGFLSFGSHTRCKTRRTQPIEANIDAALLRAAPPKLRNALHRFPKSPKEAWLREFLRNPEHLPVVVWFRHTVAQRAITEVFDRAGLTWEKIDGQTPPHKRENALLWFSTGEVKCLAVQIDTAKYGISLAGAKHVVFYEPTWSFEAYYQARKRTQKAGDASPTSFYLLSCKDTIEELVYAVQAKKENLHQRFREVLLQSA